MRNFPQKFRAEWRRSRSDTQLWTGHVVTTQMTDIVNDVENLLAIQTVFEWWHGPTAVTDEARQVGIGSYLDLMRTKIGRVQTLPDITATAVRTVAHHTIGGENA